MGMSPSFEYKRPCPKCGKEVTYRTQESFRVASLKNPNCRSCVNSGRIHSDATRKAMSKAKIASSRWVDIAGQTFGSLVANRRLGLSKGQSIWLCDCGGTNEVPLTALRSGHIRSCGCSSRAWYSRCAPDDAARNLLFVTYQRKAKERELAWDLTQKEFDTITSSPCFYCGVEPKQLFYYSPGGKYKEGSPYLYNGVDRVNNDWGYISTNVVPCCKICNYMKRVMNQSDFIHQATRIAKHMGVKNEVSI